MDQLNIDKNMWNKVQASQSEAEKVIRPSLTYAQDAWRRLRKNKLAVFGLLIVVLFCLIAAILPSFYPYSFSDQELTFNNTPPKLEIFKIDEENYVYVNKDYKIINTTGEGELLSAGILVNDDKANRTYEYDVNGHIVAVDYSVNLENVQEYKELQKNAKKDPSINLAKERRAIDKKPTFQLFVDGKEMQIEKTIRNKTYIWGSDTLGRDLFIRVVYGARISLLIGFVAAFVNLIIGVIYGGISGYLGGKVDNAMMRIVDIISTIPMILYVILLMVVMGPGLNTIIIAISITYWVNMARIVRGQVLQLKEQEYVLAAKSLGASLPRIMFKHLIPNAMGPIMVALTMQIPNAIFNEAFLSFIGLGVSAPQASWGTLCQDALSGLYTYPYQLFYPALAISITLISFNLLGDGLRDALDPKLRK
ncbi:MAG: ABC transporter permease [Firmicutes bacterium HGW-Firmicutes-7]|nr:MAG: ABC transporter permease [Firmicutes bacterium HGW-Firmicutes-7]